MGHEIDWQPKVATCPSRKQWREYGAEFGGRRRIAARFGADTKQVS
jgi:hypothetical protein